MSASAYLLQIPVIQCKLEIEYLVLAVLLLPRHALLGDLAGGLDIDQPGAGHETVYTATQNNTGALFRTPVNTFHSAVAGIFINYSFICTAKGTCLFMATSCHWIILN